MQTLILNQSYQPHRVTTWQDCITELFTGKVEVLDWYDEVIYDNPDRGITMKMPAVAKLTRTISGFKRGIKFSRINVMARDEFRCQYCGSRYHMKGLNYDHVVPRAQGGKTDWHNIVTSCLRCNGQKGARTPEQAGMRLRRTPFKPKTLPLNQPVLAMRDIPPQWEPYLGYLESEPSR